MMIVLVVLIFVFGVSLGGYLQKRLFERALRIEKEKADELKKNQFIEISKKVKSGKSKFRTRVNDMVYLSINIEEHGNVDLIYLMDKDDVAIFQQTTCLYTSDGIDKSLIDEIISTIYKIHDKKINDVVEILGFVFYREEFENSFNIKVEDLKKSDLFSNLSNDIGEIEKIKIENRRKFNIDEILDKISSLGIASLTIEERLFLDNYSNEKRD